MRIIEPILNQMSSVNPAILNLNLNLNLNIDLYSISYRFS